MTRNVLAVGLLCAACCAAGYVRGFGVAETRGRALLAEQAEASASEREALACLLAGCACTTKPLVLPPPPPKLLPLPPELARLPEAPPPLAPGYGREHP